MAGTDSGAPFRRIEELEQENEVLRERLEEAEEDIDWCLRPAPSGSACSCPPAVPPVPPVPPECRRPDRSAVARLIVEIFISRRQAVDPLRHHLEKGVLHQVLIPAVEKTGCQPRQQIQPLVGLAEQECPAAGTDRASVKTGDDFT